MSGTVHIGPVVGNSPAGHEGAPDTPCAAPADEMRPGGEDGLQVRLRSELLRRGGFRQTQVVDPSTGRAAWMWAKVWRGVRDAVIATSDGALAYRVWDADFDPREPFMVEEDLRRWSAVGNFLVVSARLLELEPPAGRAHFPGRPPRRRDLTPRAELPVATGMLAP